ncbi:MAG: flagellar biosynthesis protein FliQ [Terriglobia bacterium]
MESYLIAISKQSLYLVLILSAPAVLVAMVIGLMISLVQATTQIQEQTLTFVPKLVAVMVILSLTGPWCMVQLMAFTQNILEQFPKYLR